MAVRGSSTLRCVQLMAPAIERLVVGLDDSSADGTVMAWAQREAVARRCPLRVVSHRNDSPAELLFAAVDATLLIVGNEPLATGDRRSSCPVVVVRGTPRPSLQHILVGVDSSNASAAALDWAVGEAARHAARITVIHAWQQPVDERSVRSLDLRQADAQCIADLAADLYDAGPVPLIERRAVHGAASDVLVAASTHADLLVVGSRGRSGFRTLQFGSVALAATSRADCPVVVVHPRLITSGTGDPIGTGRPWR